MLLSGREEEHPFTQPRCPRWKGAVGPGFEVPHELRSGLRSVGAPKLRPVLAVVGLEDERPAEHRGEAGPRILRPGVDVLDPPGVAVRGRGRDRDPEQRDGSRENYSDPAVPL